MKKIINNKKYDTETAKCVGAYQYGHVGDGQYFSEKLYLKKTGEFFLYGEGGGLSRYANEVGMNEWSGGEEIMPMSRDDAMEWAEKYLDGDEFEEIFGEVEE